MPAQLEFIEYLPRGLYFITMHCRTICLEDQAKDTLAFFSERDDATDDWDCLRAHESRAKRPQLRVLNPIKNIKSNRANRTASNRSQISHRGKTPFIPTKVSLENQEPPKKSSRKIFQGNLTKQNFRPHKVFRTAYTLSKRANEKQEENGIDFMQYWIKHRFEQGSVTALVERLRPSGKTAKSLRL